MNVKEVIQPCTRIQNAGWTFVTLIRNPPSDYKAGDLAGAFGNNCTHIAAWNNATQSFVIFAKSSPSVNNFTIEAGVGYWVYTTGPATFSYSWGNIGSVNMSLKQGWNSIGRFNATATPAKSLASSIPNCTAIAYWDDTLGRFRQYIAGAEIGNFNIERGFGYLVYVTADTTWTNS
ncbi:MAG: hypothetical protein AB1485_09700, partial [Candidatus Thermoplasmatota archaeon]